MFFGNYYGCNKINSLGRKKSMETNISKNSCFHDDKSLWPILRRIIGCEKPQETIYGGPRAFWQLLRILKEHFFGNTQRLLKTQTFEKNATFPMKESFWAIFSRIIEYEKLQRTIYKGSEGFLTSIVQLIRSFLWNPRGR